MTEYHIFEPGKPAVKAHRHLNPNRVLGGWVADTATVEPSVMVYPNAIIYDYAFVAGNCEISGSTSISGDVRIIGNVTINGNAVVTGDAYIHGQAYIHNDAYICQDCNIGDNVTVYQNAKISGCAVLRDNVRIGGRAHVTGHATLINGFRASGSELLNKNMIYGAALNVDRESIGRCIDSVIRIARLIVEYGLDVRFASHSDYTFMILSTALAGNTFRLVAHMDSLPARDCQSSLTDISTVIHELCRNELNRTFFARELRALSPVGNNSVIDQRLYSDL